MVGEQLAELLATRRAPSGPHLEVLGGPEDGRTCALKVGVTRIGRDPDNQLDLSFDAALSPNHARIEWRDGGYYLQDSSSRGGTAVDGDPIEGHVRLRAGQVISVGKTKLLFHASRASADGADERA